MTKKERLDEEMYTVRSDYINAWYELGKICYHPENSIERIPKIGGTEYATCNYCNCTRNYNQLLRERKERLNE